MLDPAVHRQTHTPDAAPVRPREPRGMLITSRVNFDAAVHAPLAQYMAAQFGTRTFVLVARGAVARKWSEWTSGSAVTLNDDKLRAEGQAASADWAAVQKVAAAFERRYGITYMRDILHQDKGIAAYYLQHSSGSAFARQEPPALPFLIALVNTYFTTIEGLLEEYPIDLFITRSSGLFNSVAVAIARRRQIPVTWLNHARVGKQMIWMEGPDHSASLVKANYPPPESVTIPEDVAPPPDTVSARVAALRDESIVKLATDLAKMAADRLIMRTRDLKSGSWHRRLPLRGFVLQHCTRWRTARYLAARAKADQGKLVKGRYILFLLHLDPEYSSSTLARQFNHTHAIIQQLALSLPVGYTLAIKEHVVGLGNRSLSFYKELGHLPNVLFVDHRGKALDIARDAVAVASVWGTICLEASLIGVPVICFTDNSEYRVLRNVHTVRTPTEISDAVRAALSPRSAAEVRSLRQDAARFRDAQLRLSFHLSTIELDEHGNRNRENFGLPQPELEEATARLLAVYRAGGGTAQPIA
jgi:hypothetical protein